MKKNIALIAGIILAFNCIAQQLQYNRFATTPDGQKINGDTITNVAASKVDNATGTNLNISGRFAGTLINDYGASGYNGNVPGVTNTPSGGSFSFYGQNGVFLFDYNTWLSPAGNGSLLTALNASQLNSGTVPAARQPAYTGDATSSAGSTALTLATVATPGTSTKLTYNGKGLITSGTALTIGDLPAGYNNGGAAATVTQSPLTNAVTNLPTMGTPGTYRSVTVDTKGRVASGSNPTTFAGYGLSDTSDNLRAALNDSTGTGAAVFATGGTINPSSLKFQSIHGDINNDGGWQANYLKTASQITFENNSYGDINNDGGWHVNYDDVTGAVKYQGGADGDLSGDGGWTASYFSGPLHGNADTATSATSFSGSLTGDVTGTQSATVLRPDVLMTNLTQPAITGGRKLVLGTGGWRATMLTNGFSLSTTNTSEYLTMEWLNGKPELDALALDNSGFTLTPTYLIFGGGAGVDLETNGLHFSGSPAALNDYGRDLATGKFTGTFTGNGGGLTNLPFAIGFSSANGYWTATSTSTGSSNWVFTVTNISGGNVTGQLNGTNLVGTLTNNTTGNATTAATATSAISFSGTLTGDVTGTQGATVVTATIPRLGSTNIWTGSNIVAGVIIATNESNVLAGNGAAITGITAGQISGLIFATNYSFTYNPLAMATVTSNTVFYVSPSDNSKMAGFYYFSFGMDVPLTNFWPQFSVGKRFIWTNSSNTNIWIRFNSDQPDSGNHFTLFTFGTTNTPTFAASYWLGTFPYTQTNPMQAGYLWSASTGSGGPSVTGTNPPFIQVVTTFTNAFSNSISTPFATIGNGVINATLSGPGSGIGALSLDATTPTFLLTNMLSTFNVMGDSFCAGTSSSPPSGGLLSFVYMFQSRMTNKLNGLNAQRVQPVISFVSNFNGGWTLFNLNRLTQTSPSPAASLILEAAVNDEGFGFTTSTFTTPDAFAFYNLTNIVGTNLIWNATNSTLPPAIFTCANWVTASYYNSLLLNVKITNNFTWFPAATNLLGYIGTNSSGAVVTTNSITYSQYVVNVYNYNVRVVKYAQDNHLPIVRMDKFSTPIISSDGIHPAYNTHLQIAANLYNALYNGNEDYEAPKYYNLDGVFVFIGNGGSLTNINPANVTAWTTFSTNFTTATIGSNTWNRPISLFPNIIYGEAAVVGASSLQVEIAGTTTNYAVPMVTIIGGVAQSLKGSVMPVIVPVNGTWYFRDTSSGVGNSCSPTNGQIQIQ